MQYLPERNCKYVPAGYVQVSEILVRTSVCRYLGKIPAHTYSFCNKIPAHTYVGMCRYLIVLFSSCCAGCCVVAARCCIALASPLHLRRIAITSPSHCRLIAVVSLSPSHRVAARSRRLADFIRITFASASGTVDPFHAKEVESQQRALDGATMRTLVEDMIES
jgi:hypothetical protein